CHTIAVNITVHQRPHSIELLEGVVVILVTVFEYFRAVQQVLITITVFWRVIILAISVYRVDRGVYLTSVVTQVHCRLSVNSLLIFIPVKSYRSEEHTSELQSRFDLVCRLL